MENSDGMVPFIIIYFILLLFTMPKANAIHLIPTIDVIIQSSILYIQPKKTNKKLQGQAKG